MLICLSISITDLCEENSRYQYLILYSCSNHNIRLPSTKQQIVIFNDKLQTDNLTLSMTADVINT